MCNIRYLNKTLQPNDSIMLMEDFSLLYYPNKAPGDHHLDNPMSQYDMYLISSVS